MMYNLETLIEDIKNPRHIVLGAVIFIFCMVLGTERGSLGGLVVGIITGLFLSFSGLILIQKHREKQEEMRESIIIPKIGLSILYWISPIIYYALQAANR